MPLYSYKCKTCQTPTTKINKIADHINGAPWCCDTQMVQTITAETMGLKPMGAKHFDNYLCPVSEQVVTSEKQRHNIESEHEITRIEKGMFKTRTKSVDPDIPDDLKPELAKYRKKINA